MRAIHRTSLRLVAGILTATLLSGNLAWAEGRNQQRERLARQAIQALMTNGDGPVAITLANGTRHQGRLQALGERSFLIVDERGRMTQVAYRQVQQSARLSTGKIVAIAAVTAGVILMIWCGQVAGNAFCIPQE